MRAGDLSERITIQRPVETRDDYGAVVETWASLVVDLPAAAEPLKGAELVTAGARYAEALYKFRIRHRADVTSKMRLLWGMRTFEVIGEPVDPTGKRRELHLTGRELQ